MPAEGFATEFQTTVSSLIGSTDTTFNLTSTAGLPASPTQFRLRLEPAGGSLAQYELVVCQIASGTTVTTVGTRAAAQEGTSGQSWAVGSLCSQVITAGGLNNLVTGPAKFNAHASVATSLTGLGITQVALQTVDFDTASGFAGNTYTVPVAGIYLVTWAIQTSIQNAGQDFYASVYVNGGQAAIGSRSVTRGGTAGDAIGSVGSRYMTLAATNTLKLYGYIGIGGNACLTSTNLGGVDTFLGAALVR